MSLTKHVVKEYKTRLAPCNPTAEHKNTVCKTVNLLANKKDEKCVGSVACKTRVIPLLLRFSKIDISSFYERTYHITIRN